MKNKRVKKKNFEFVLIRVKVDDDRVDVVGSCIHGKNYNCSKDSSICGGYRGCVKVYNLDFAICEEINQ